MASPSSQFGGLASGPPLAAPCSPLRVQGFIGGKFLVQKNRNTKELRTDRLLDFMLCSKNTGAWKGRLKGFFVDPYTVELAKNGTNIT